MSLDSLVGGPVRTSRPTTARGRVVGVTADRYLRVVIPSYSGARDFEVPPEQWGSAQDPTTDGECLVVFDEQGDVWVPLTGITAGQTDLSAIEADFAVLEASFAAIVATMGAQGKGYIAHGTNANYPRGTDFVSYEWVGSVQPLNATDGDTWINVVI